MVAARLAAQLEAELQKRRVAQLAVQRGTQRPHRPQPFFERQVVRDGAAKQILARVRLNCKCSPKCYRKGQKEKYEKNYKKRKMKTYRRKINFPLGSFPSKNPSPC